MKRSSVVFAASLVTTITTLGLLEGTELETYTDGAGVKTACSGETRWINKGDKFTAEQCNYLKIARAAGFKEMVYSALKFEVSPDTLSGHTVFSYNIGESGYKNSTTLRLTNAGDVAGGCEAMKYWRRSGGKNCCLTKGLTNAQGGCYGMVTKHRATAMQLCYRGIGQEYTREDMAERICPSR